MNTNDSPTDLPGRNRRKPNRLTYYDYSTPGYYFITICTENHRPLLGKIAHCEGDAAIAKMVLNETGQAVEDSLLAIPSHYANTIVDKYVIMPNHVHLILAIRSDFNCSAGNSSAENPPSIPRIIQQFKRAVSIRLGKSIWQLGFHDHVIRGETDYQEIWSYIDNNPLKWALDKYYCEI